MKYLRNYYLTCDQLDLKILRITFLGLMQPIFSVYLAVPVLILI